MQRLIIRHSFFQPFLTRFITFFNQICKFDMREAYCSSSNDVYKNSSSSRVEKEWLGNVPLSLKIFNDQILDPFFPILSRGVTDSADSRFDVHFTWHSNGVYKLISESR